MTGRYWREHLLEPVRFADCVRTASAGQNVIFLEVGWGSALAGFAEAQGGVLALSSLPLRSGAVGERALLLDAAAQLWCRGAPVDWSAVLPGGGVPVSLPGYPFKRDRFWIDSGQPVAPLAATPPDRGVALYEPSFHRAAPARKPLTEQRGPWLVLFPHGPTAAAIVEELRSAGESIIVVEEGTEFSAVGSQQYALAPERPSEVKRLFGELERTGNLPVRIVAFAGQKADDLDPWQPFARGLSLCQATIGRYTSGPMQIWFVTSGAMDVLGDEPLRTEAAMTLALTRVMLQETGVLIGRHLDLPPAGAGGSVSAQAAAELLSEPDETLIALRAGQRWCLGVRRLEEASAPVAPPIRSNGVYLITGGLGRLGLVLARHLTLVHGARVVLTTRQAPEAAMTFERRRTLDELRAKGAKVEIRTADAADLEATRALIAGIRDRHERLDGVIHAAGIVGELAHRSLAETSVDRCRAMFGAKVAGVEALAKALTGSDYDFVMLISSMSPLLGGLGLGGYAAANIYMDGFAARADGPGRWLSVNWEGWSRQGGDMAGSEASEIAGLVLDDQEIALRFEQALAIPHARRVIVAKGDLDDRLRRWATVAGLSRLFETAPTPKHDDVQAVVRQYASELLGHEAFGDDDNLLEHGANSLTAIRLIARIRETFNVDLPMRTLFDNPTVRSLTEAVNAMHDDDEGIVLELIEEAGAPAAEHTVEMVASGRASGEGLYRDATKGLE